MQENYEGMSVQELAQRAKNDDSLAFAQLYERFSTSIYHYALKLARNEADAKDIVQDTFIQAQLSIKSLKEPKLFKVWLNKIAFSRATRLFSRNRTVSFDPEDSAYIDHAVDERMEMNPQDMIHFQSDKELLDYFISQLPIDQQAALVLMYYEHYTLHEIADIMDIPIGTVKSRIHTAKTKLNDMITAYEKRNDIKLTFKGNALVPALTALYSGNSSLLSPKSSFHLFDFIRTSLGKMILVSGCAVACAGVGIYTLLNNNSEGEFTQNIQLYPFDPITYQSVTYDRAEDVYYALIDFAHCDIEMADKKTDEFKEILPLYEALKSYGGIYYDKLNENNWIALFEAYVY